MQTYKSFILTAIFLLNSLFLFSQSPMEERIDTLINKMSLQEKVDQLANNGFMTTPTNERLEIPGFVMDDGPHGVRFEGATSFPVAMASAATWDTDLIGEMGKILGEEFHAFGKDQQLGPSLDLTHDPRNGRTSESVGEDPFLGGKIISAMVEGVQKNPVIATIKHFNLVSRQKSRYSSDITVSERHLMELYGENFRRVIQEAGPMCIMSAYNLINGTHCSENKKLLDTILRQNWGFPYYVVSDWGSIHNTEYAIEAGNDVCMGSDDYAAKLPALASNNSVTEETLNEAVRNVLRTKILSGMMDYRPDISQDVVYSNEHHQMCREVGKKSIVLLKNRNDILPLQKDALSSIALIGPNADTARLSGYGSSWVDPTYTVNPKRGIENKINPEKVIYRQGCKVDGDDDSKMAEAISVADTSEIVIFVGGLSQLQEGEGYGDGGDRKNGSIELPGLQNELIDSLTKVNDQVIVVLKSGGICGVNSFINDIEGLVYAFYPGQEGGNALADVLFGDYNPAGRLPQTMPKSDSQLPERNNNFNDDYGGGYRWFDAQNITPEFAFGFGLSYTTFNYSNLQVNPVSTIKGEPVTVSVDVENTGDVAGEEVVQSYLTDQNSTMWMPEKELKGFDRISLNPGEKKTVTFTLNAEDFYYWNEENNQYEIEAGDFTVKVGGSSNSLPLEKTFTLTEGTTKPDLKITEVLTMPRYPLDNQKVSFFAFVKNQGVKSTSQGTEHEVSFKINNTKVASANYTLSGLMPGEAKLIPASGFWEPGKIDTFNLTASIDPNNNVTESIEENNTLETGVTVFDRMEAPRFYNLAYKKPVNTSSVEENDLLGKYAVDGNKTSSRWASEQKSDPQNFVVDLQGYYNINHVRIFWETAYASEYKIQASMDSTNWKTLVHETSGNGGKDSYEVSDTCRYVKIHGISRGTEWGYSIYEFEVMGEKTDISESIVFSNTLKKISVSPNPASKKIMINNLPYRGKTNCEIFDITGKKINTYKISKNSHKIDITHLSKGVYIISFEYNKNKNFIKFIKE